MFNQSGFDEIIRNFARLLECNLTVWSNQTILCTTRKHYSPYPKDWPIINYAGKYPYAIFKTKEHPCCQVCLDVESCSYEREYYVPFSEPFLKGSGVCFQFWQKSVVWFERMGQEKGLGILQDYVYLLENLIEKSQSQQKEILLEQQASYMAELFPTGLVLLDEKDQVTHMNEAAKKYGLVQFDQKKKTSTLVLGKFNNLIKRKDFYFDKERLGSCVHMLPATMSLRSTENYEQDRSPLPKLIGTSPTLQKAIDIAKQAARSDSTILIRGESGTGKEMFARMIHDTSPRSSGPFIAINCAAIPEGLLESELFGYEEGSFTGAKKGGKTGKIELANQGTLFLDEIGDMPLSLQAKLLRVIQEKRIDRIGGSKSIAVNIRLVAATHRNLEEMIAQAKFREDLYFRLNVIPIHIPPLRERLGDIELLLNFYLRKYCTLLQKSYKKFSYTALEKLRGYAWSGNIRELENMVEYLVNIHDEDLITIEDLPIHSSIRLVQPQAFSQHQPEVSNSRVVTQGKVNKENIITLLNQWGWDTEGKRQAAMKLGISIATLYRWLKKYKIES
ncbi:sigma-54 interaction domain-containing protein [Desulfosporosinus metallidurans]|nr:sigma 54-interacting transcriptional regulator [Desulfosporosinus metallidurans]